MPTRRQGAAPQERMIRLEAVALGDASPGVGKRAVEVLEFTLEGIVGDRHAGFTKRADARDQGVKRGTPVRNWRQWSAVSLEELAQIAAGMGIARVEPAWLGANLAFSGCDGLTQLPKGSMLWFASGLVLAVEGENVPCSGPGKEIARHLAEAPAARFVPAARGLRGLVGVVYRAGRAAVGDMVIVRPYQPNLGLPKPPQRPFPST
jgi:MOSC domain-containing protein YiiM